MIEPHLRYGSFCGRRVHLGVTGSVAAYKAADVCRDLLHNDLLVSATLSGAAQRFVAPLTFEALGADPVYTGMFAPGEPHYAHLEPGQNADALLVAPCTANTLGKLASGIADDMLSCQALAMTGPTVLAPAMNPNLWNAPATRENIQRLRDRGVRIVQPESGSVACGDTGQGRLAPLEEIFFQTLRAMTGRDLSGATVLLTLGPTREYWDALRYWSNPSSGKMGAALAVAAWLRGAEVHCVCGPNSLWLPRGINLYPVQSATEMYERSLEIWPHSDIGCLTAAVCDFRPRPYGPDKFKKDRAVEGSLCIELEPNPDILASLGRQKGRNQKLIGFAAETASDVASAASSKLEAKNLDLIVANRIDQHRSCFGSAVNDVLIQDRLGGSEACTATAKSDIAWKIWDWISRI
jgi:phosphopantothenoylcysteine decarboxylase/phosphopantothenate--cysteine ligase